MFNNISSIGSDAGNDAAAAVGVPALACDDASAIFGVDAADEAGAIEDDDGPAEGTISSTLS